MPVPNSHAWGVTLPDSQLVTHVEQSLTPYPCPPPEYGSPECPQPCQVTRRWPEVKLLLEMAAFALDAMLCGNKGNDGTYQCQTGIQVMKGVKGHKSWLSSTYLKRLVISQDRSLLRKASL